MKVPCAKIASNKAAGESTTNKVQGSWGLHLSEVNASNSQGTIPAMLTLPEVSQL